MNRPLLLAAAALTAATVASCSSTDTTAAPASSSAPSTATSTTAASSTTAAPTTTEAQVDENGDLTAVGTIDWLSSFGPGTAAYLDAVDSVYPLTTSEDANTFVGYAIGLCYAREQEGAEFVRSHQSEFPNDFADQYGMTIDDDVAAVIADNYEPACSD